MCKMHWLHHDLWWSCCTNTQPSHFHQCKVTLDTISFRMKSTSRVEVYCSFVAGVKMHVFMMSQEFFSHTLFGISISKSQFLDKKTMYSFFQSCTLFFQPCMLCVRLQGVLRSAWHLTKMVIHDLSHFWLHVISVCTFLAMRAFPTCFP